MNTATSLQRIRVALVEDDPLCRERLEGALNDSPDTEVVASFGEGKPALAWLESNAPDVLLCDLGLPDLPGLAVIAYCTQVHRNTDVMVITMYEDDDHVMRSLEAGATGYLLKDSVREDIARSVVELRAGGAPMSPSIARRVLQRMQPSHRHAPAAGVDIADALTPKELLVLNRIAQGFGNAEIAKLEGISANTVHSHVKRIYAKLAVHSRTEAVYEANQMGLLRS